MNCHIPLAPTRDTAVGFEAAFDHRREREILRDALGLEDFEDHVEILAGATHPETDDLSMLRREAIDEVLHLRVHRDRVRRHLHDAKPRRLQARGFGKCVRPGVEVVGNPYRWVIL
jgi:hypothetical protein